jgi:hypothetical protein
MFIDHVNANPCRVIGIGRLGARNDTRLSETRIVAVWATEIASRQKNGRCDATGKIDEACFLKADVHIFPVVKITQSQPGKSSSGLAESVASRRDAISRQRLWLITSSIADSTLYRKAGQRDRQ